MSCFQSSWGWLLTAPGGLREVVLKMVALGVCVSGVQELQVLRGLRCRHVQGVVEVRGEQVGTLAAVRFCYEIWLDSRVSLYLDGR